MYLMNVNETFYCKRVWIKYFTTKRCQVIQEDLKWWRAHYLLGNGFQALAETEKIEHVTLVSFSFLDEYHLAGMR